MSSTIESSKNSRSSFSKTSSLFGTARFGRIAEGFTFLGFQTLKAPLPPLFMRLFLAIEWIQLLSFGVDPMFHIGSGFENFFGGWIRSRNPTLSLFVPGASISIAVIAGFVLAAVILQVLLIYRGGIGIRPIYIVIRLLCDFGRVFLLPAFYLLVASTQTGTTKTNQVLFTAIFVLLGIVLIILSFLTASELQPSTSRYCINRPLWPAIWTAAKIVIATSDILLKNQSNNWGLIVHGCIVLFIGLFNCISGILFVPFLVKPTNHGLVGLFGAMTFAQLVSLISLAGVSKSFKLGMAIALVAGLIPSVIFTILIATLRFRPSLVALPLGRKTSEVGVLYKSAICYDIATRDIYSKKLDSATIERAESILEEGIRIFPNSALLKLSMAMFLIDIKKDQYQLRHFFNNLEFSEKPPLDIALKLAYISKSINIRTGELLSDVDQLELSLASKHSRKAKKALAEFWGRLARKRREIDSEFVVKTANEIDEHETAAEKLFLDVMARNARNCNVIRRYARFLKEIKDDAENAEIFFQQADIEEVKNVKPKKQKEVTVQESTQFELPNVVNVVDGKKDDDEGSLSITLSERQFGSNSPDYEQSVEIGGSGGVTFAEATSSSSKLRNSISIDSLGSASGLANNRSKLLEYRAKIGEAQRTASARYQSITIFELLLLIALSVVIYVIAQQRVSKIQGGIEAEAGSCFASQDVTKFPRLSRQVWEETGVIAMNKTREILIAKDDFIKQWETSFNSSVARERWFERNLQVILYSQGPSIGKGIWIPKNISLLESCVILSGHMNVIAANLENGLQLDIKEVSWRFVLDNGFTISKKLQEIVEHIGDSEKTRFTGIVTVLIPIASAWALFSLCFAITVGLIGLKEGSKKTQTAIELFKEIPKATCVNIYERLSKQEDDEQGMKDLLEAKSVGVNVLFQLQFIGIYLGMIILTFTTIAVCLSFVRSVEGTDRLIFELSHEISATSETQFLINEKFVTDSIGFWKPQDEIPKSVLARLEDLQETEVKIKEIALGLSNFNVDLWLNSRPCPRELEEMNITCSGLAGLLLQYKLLATDLVVFNSTLEKAQKIIKIQAIYKVLEAWQIESFSELYKHLVTSSEQTISNFSWILAVAITFCVVLGISYLGTVNKVTTTNVRVISLLLMAPTEVLTKIDAVQFLFESGINSSNQLKIKGAIKEQEKRTRLILECVADAVVVIDDKGLIEMMNPAAERLLSVKATAISGHLLANLFVDEIAHRFKLAVDEVVSKAQQGTVIPFPMGDQFEVVTKPTGEEEAKVLLTSTSVSIAADEVSFALLMKDIKIFKEHEQAIEREKQRADALLLNILPKGIAEELKNSREDHVIAQTYNSVTVMFADIVQFTQLASGVDARELVELLNAIFSPWDKLCEEFGVEKIKTIGDCYMAACGTPDAHENHAERVLDFCVMALESLAAFNSKRQEKGQQPIKFRFGVHSGSVVGGVIGSQKFQFDIWGNTVNIASRLESAGIPERIQVSTETMELCKKAFTFESRGPIELKGKGKVECFLVVSPIKPIKRGDILSRVGSVQGSLRSYIQTR